MIDDDTAPQWRTILLTFSLGSLAFIVVLGLNCPLRLRDSEKMKASLNIIPLLYFYTKEKLKATRTIGEHSGRSCGSFDGSIPLPVNGPLR
jgi:hypothetical protein